jgi:hypothetical protein
MSQYSFLSILLLFGHLQNPVFGAVPTNNTGAASIASVDIVANWHFTAYSDGACQQAISGSKYGGNTPRGCTNLSQQAKSYVYTSFQDPKSGVQYSAQFFTGFNCQYSDGSDGGNTDNCRAKVFESFDVTS